MKGAPLVPPDFDAPRSLDLGGLRLSVLGVDDLDPDYEAVRESGAALHDLFHIGDRWPDGLTREANLIDLAWHQKEFVRRTSFAWGLRSPEGRYLGSAYLYRDPEIDAAAAGGGAGQAHLHAVHWLRPSAGDDALRAQFRAAWEAWARSWPAAGVRFSP